MQGYVNHVQKGQSCPVTAGDNVCLPLNGYCRNTGNVLSGLHILFAYFNSYLEDLNYILKSWQFPPEPEKLLSSPHQFK